MQLKLFAAGWLESSQQTLAVIVASVPILAPLFWYLLSFLPWQTVSTASHSVEQKLGWEMTKILAMSPTTISGTSEAVITVRCEAHFPVNVDNRSGLCSICPGL